MYDPTSRALTVLELLQTQPVVRGRELAERLEMDVRTVRRYITKLQDAGLPIESIPGRYGGYRLRAGYKLPPLVFSLEEALAIYLGLRSTSGGTGGVCKAAAESALSKVSRVLPKEARDRLQPIISDLYIFPARSAETPPKTSVFVALSEAARQERCVELTYRSREGAVTTRMVEPYGLAGRNGSWYLVGYCRLRSGFRTFRLAGISEARVLEETFKRDPAFDFRAFATAQLESYGTTWRMVVHFEADLATMERVAPPYGTLRQVPDGVVFECSTDDLNAAAGYLMLFDIPFTVVEPQELRDALRRLAERALRTASRVPPLLRDGVDEETTQGAHSQTPRE